MVTTAHHMSLWVGVQLVCFGDAKAQDNPSTDMTLVTATRFVTKHEGESARALFENARIQLSEFNETDHCIDQGALETATEYFDKLGRELVEAGHFYFLPEVEMKHIVKLCERSVGAPPQAWELETTQAVAFGRVVPASIAASLEQKLR